MVGQVWGVTIGGTILQNELGRLLPEEFSALFPQAASFSYSAIPYISRLPTSLRSEVQRAFAKSLQPIWRVMIGVGGLGLIISLAMKALPLHTTTDEEWGMKDDVRKTQGSVETPLNSHQQV